MPRAGQRVLTFSLEDAHADYFLARDPEPVLTCRGEPLLPLSAMRLQGLHNAANALAALAMCEALELPRGPVLDALAAFGGLPHRAQWVADVGGVRFVHDSKGTNVGATIAAVSGMSGPLVRSQAATAEPGLRRLRDVFRGKVRHAVLIGRDAPRLAATLEGVRSTERATDMPPPCGGAVAARAATRCCCHPPAPASTCSAITRIAATSSPRREGLAG
jgi:UDP-N-acetylmuramoylalanine--D-glutamate ligase